MPPGHLLGRRRTDDESGTSLTEFAIIAPLIILLVFWAQFFTDLGIFKLKLDEAARYAEWEMAAQRDPHTVATEITNKFQKLYSPDYNAPPHHPFGVWSFTTGVTVTKATINDRISAKFGGHLPSGGGGGGIVGWIVGAIQSFLGWAVDHIIGLYGFNTAGEAQATNITFQAQNTLFPGTDFRWLAFKLNDNAPPHITMTAVSSPLLVDTWKAWPGKYSLSSNNLDTSPMATYGAPGAPDTELAARMKKVAFMGLKSGPLSFVGTVLDWVGKLASFGGLPGIMLTRTWNQGGPSGMFPGDTPKHHWEPGGGMPQERAGTEYSTSQHLTGVSESLDPGIDRLRSATPSAIHTDWWKTGGFGGFGGPFGIFGSVSDGGYGGLASPYNHVKWGPSNRRNPYVLEYRCRDAWYMGGHRGQVQRWGKSLSSWARDLTPQCR